MTRPPWTPEQLDTLRRLYAMTPTIQIAEQIGRPLRATYQKAKDLGLSPDNAEQYRQAVTAAATLASIDAQTHPRGKPQSWRLMCEQTGRVVSYCAGEQGWTERAA